jgi:O-antigen/teichoic acid export membrane protein
VLKNISSNWALNALQILVFMALTRFTLDVLGQETFGIWEAVIAVAGPLQLMILGVPMATVRAISRALGRGDDREAQEALGQSLTLTLILAGGALAAGGLLWWGFEDRLLDSQRWALDSNAILDTRTALAIVLINLAVGFCLRLPYAVFEAFHDFIPRNLIMGAGMLLRLGLTVGALTWDTSLRTLALVQALVAVAEFSAALVVLRKRHGSVRFRPAALSLGQAKKLLSFGVFAFLLNMGALLAFKVDALVVANHMLPTDVAVYGMANKIFDPLINLLLAIGMVVMPAAATMRARNQESELKDLLFKWSKVAVFIVLTLGSYLLVFGPEFLAWWLGDEYDPAAGPLLQVLMASFLLFLPVRGVALPILLGSGNPRGPAIGLLAMGLGNLVLSLILVRSHGILGVALGTAIPNVIFSLFFIASAGKTFNVRPAEWTTYALGRVGLGLLPGLALLLLIKFGPGANGFWPLVAVGLAFVALQSSLALFFVWRGDPHVDPLQVLRDRRREGQA